MLLDIILARKTPIKKVYFLKIQKIINSSELLLLHKLVIIVKVAHYIYTAKKNEMVRQKNVNIC
jgi:hypothetical protein